jgi:type IV secretion system protein VirD4
VAKAVGVGLGLLALAHQLRTQWLAEALGQQAALGKPAFVAYGIPVYGFWRSSAWVERLSQVPEAADIVRNATLWSFLSTALCTVLTVHLFVRGARADRNRADELHGSAHWARREDIERAGLFAIKGIVAGKWLEVRWFFWTIARYLRHFGPEHVLAFAPTGTGKGVGLVLPTLLTWPESCVVLDPKGENYAKTSGWRQSIGQQIFKLDFSAHPSETAGFNPLSAVRLRTAHETADVQRIARLIVDPDGRQFEGSNKHWAETASSLLTGAILHVLYREGEEGRCATLADVVSELSDKHRSHAQVLLDWGNFAHDPTFLQGWQDDGVPTATHPVVAASAREQLNREEKERGAVLSSAITPLALFRDPVLAANTSRSDFSIEQLMDQERPVTLYFVLPSDDIQRLRPIVRIMFDVMLRRLMPPMSIVDGDLVTSHKHQLLLLLDEFPILGKLEVFSEALAYMRGWGIRAYLICQDYEQLRATYGDRETISSNCQLQLAYAPNKFETAKHLSQMAGTMTAVKRAVSASQSIGRFASSRNSESEQEVSRPLVTPDECMRLPGPRKRGKEIVKPGDMLVFFAGSPPIYAQQPLYFRDPTLLARSRIPPAPPKPPMLSSALPAPQAPAAVPAAPPPPELDHVAVVSAVTLVSSPSQAPSTVTQGFELDEELMALGAGLDDSHSVGGSDEESDREDSEDDDPFADEPLLGDEVAE